jgi:peptidoglycan hydrolase CwlO-like protein
MKIKKSFSKYGKYLSKTADMALQKSGELISLSKINMEISSIQSSIEDLYTEIGERIYRRYEKGKFSDHDLEEYFRSIDKYKKEIKELKRQISRKKDKRTCNNCGAQVYYESKYCPACGSKQD